MGWTVVETLQAKGVFATDKIAYPEKVFTAQGIKHNARKQWRELYFLVRLKAFEFLCTTVIYIVSLYSYNISDMAVMSSMARLSQ